MTKLDAGLITPLPASDPGSTAAWGSKRINPRPQSYLSLTWSGYFFKRRRRRRRLAMIAAKQKLVKFNRNYLFSRRIVPRRIAFLQKTKGLNLVKDC